MIDRELMNGHLYWDCHTVVGCHPSDDDEVLETNC